MAHRQDFQRAALQGHKPGVRIHSMHRTHEIALFSTLVDLEKRIVRFELRDINARADGHMQQSGFGGGALQYILSSLPTDLGLIAQGRYMYEPEQLIARKGVEPSG